MRARTKRRRKRNTPKIAFINMPYSKRYERLYLAYIAGLSAYGLVPTAALTDPSSTYQLDRIMNLIYAADFSFHELSWMGVDRKRPRTPRFNMPFELGIAVANSRIANRKHQWFVFDTIPHRLDKALSDLTGVRARVHDKTPRGLFRALMNALTRERYKPALDELLAIYVDVARKAKQIKRDIGSNNLFDNRPFADLTLEASRSAHERIHSLRTR